MTPDFDKLAEQISKTLGVVESTNAKTAVIAASLKDAYFKGMGDSHRETRARESFL
jgi:hypothetical protein